ncbi:MAG: hypothetical protein VX899_00455 [Myxococcota bacterium]|nr:hypothetical protein [Myxococcota bacterium]
MLDWILAGVVVLICAALASAGLRFGRKQKRRQAAALSKGETPVLQQLDVPARVYVDRTLLGGPVAGKINHLDTDILLTEGRLVVATHQGRLLEVLPGKDGSVRCTGPGRLVIEGMRPSAKEDILVRVEALVPTADQWAARAKELLGTRTSAVPTRPKMG